jgi:hypothetical protein
MIVKGRHRSSQSSRVVLTRQPLPGSELLLFMSMPTQDVHATINNGSKTAKRRFVPTANRKLIAQ